MLRLGSSTARLKLKGYGGDFYKRWNMLFNLMVREKSYQVDISITLLSSKVFRGAAWLLSVRVVKYLG